MLMLLRIDALDQWCLRRSLGFKWSDFVRNEDVRHATQQPPLSFIVKTSRLCSLLMFILVPHNVTVLVSVKIRQCRDHTVRKRTQLLLYNFTFSFLSRFQF